MHWSAKTLKKQLRALKNTKFYRSSGFLTLAIAAGLSQLAVSNIGYQTKPVPLIWW